MFFLRIRAKKTRSAFQYRISYISPAYAGPDPGESPEPPLKYDNYKLPKILHKRNFIYCSIISYNKEYKNSMWFFEVEKGEKNEKTKNSGNIISNHDICHAGNAAECTFCFGRRKETDWCHGL